MPKRLRKKERTITRELFLCETAIVDYIRDHLNFHGVQQAAVLRKTDCNQGKTTVETWCLLTSASREKLPPKDFLKTIQKHWQIENGLHHVKDRTLKEDEHVTHSPEQETALAIFRNVAVSVLNLLTPPKNRKESRPAQMLRHAANTLKLLKQLHSL
jgi:predicted transposase YbfD/YdcC